MPGGLYFLLLLLLLWVGSSKAKAKERDDQHNIEWHIGGVIDNSSRVGREQELAMEMAVQDFNRYMAGSSFKQQLVLHFNDNDSPRGSLARAASAVVELIDKKRVRAIIGAVPLIEAALVSMIDKTSYNIPIISLTSPGIPPPQQLPSIIQMSNDITFHMQCIAAIVGFFKWRKLTLIYENQNDFSTDFGLVTLLSDSLRIVNSEVEHHLAIRSLASLSNPEAVIKDELKKLMSKSNRVFVLLKCCLELGNMIFDQATQMGMMEKGYVWTVSEDIAGLLHSLNSSAFHNMQGVLGFKTNFLHSSKSFRRFKTRFRRMYESKYPQEEEYSNPSIFAHRAYDAIWTVGRAMEKSQTKFPSLKLFQNLLSSNFEGLSGKIIFKNGKLAENSTFQIINVVGTSYREMALWSPLFGLCETSNFNKSVKELGLVYWPGGLQTVPKGRSSRNEGGPLKIGVPAKAAFNQFVTVSYDQGNNVTSISGFSVDVFKAVVKHLPYHLPYVLLPYNDSYDDLVKRVFYQDLDGAIGDIAILADRCQYAEFSLSYIDAGLAMVVPVKADKSQGTWHFLTTFTTKMWLLMLGMHLFVGFVIWLVEREDNHDLKGFGSVLWFSVTIIFFAQKEPLRNNLSRLVLAPWLFVILIVTASFTANLTSMLTVSRLQPSILDIETLQRTNAAVGCNGNSFVVKYLINVLHFKDDNIKKINSIDDYPMAFEMGIIKAAFFTSPHADVFLTRFCKGYTKAGPTLNLGGLGFVFPKRSPLLFDISKAILEVIESGEIKRLKEYMLSSIKCTYSRDIIDSPSIGPRPFSGLLFISGGISSVAFFAAILRLAKRKLHIVHLFGETIRTRRVWRLFNYA